MAVPVGFEPTERLRQLAPAVEECQVKRAISIMKSLTRLLSVRTIVVKSVVKGFPSLVVLEHGLVSEGQLLA